MNSLRYRPHGTSMPLQSLADPAFSSRGRRQERCCSRVAVAAVVPPIPIACPRVRDVWPPAVGTRCANCSVKPSPLPGKRAALFSSMIATLIIPVTVLQPQRRLKKRLLMGTYVRVPTDRISPRQVPCLFRRHVCRPHFCATRSRPITQSACILRANTLLPIHGFITSTRRFLAPTS